jgi:O-antigen/teichoic acid export membrane protein
MRLYIVSTSIYLTLFVVLTSQFGLIGAGVAASIAAALPLIGMLVLIRGNKFF